MKKPLPALNILPYSKEYIESKQKEYLGKSILFGIGSVSSLIAAIGFGFAAYQASLTIAPWLNPNNPGNIIYQGSAQYGGSLLVFGPIGLIFITGIVFAYFSIPAIPIIAGLACVAWAGYSAYRCYQEASKYYELKNSFTNYDKTEFDDSLANDFAADQKLFDQAFETELELNKLVNKLIFKYAKKKPEEAIIKIKDSVIEKIKKFEIITVAKLKYYDFSEYRDSDYKSRELAVLLKKAMDKLTEEDMRQNPDIFKHITKKNQNTTTTTISLAGTNAQTQAANIKPEFSFNYEGLYNCRKEIYALLERKSLLKELLKDEKIVEFDYAALEDLVKREAQRAR